MKALVIAALLASPAPAAVRVLSTTGALTSGDLKLKAGDELPNAEVRLASGTATLSIDGGRFLLTGPARFTPRKTSFRLDLGSLLSVLTHKAGRRFSVTSRSVTAIVCTPSIAIPATAGA